MMHLTHWHIEWHFHDIFMTCLWHDDMTWWHDMMSWWHHDMMTWRWHLHRNLIRKITAHAPSASWLSFATLWATLSYNTLPNSSRCESTTPMAIFRELLLSFEVYPWIRFLLRLCRNFFVHAAKPHDNTTLRIFILRQIRKIDLYAAEPHVQKPLQHSRNNRCIQKRTLIQL